MTVPEKTLPIPTADLATFILDEPRYDENKPIYVDARNPSRTHSLRQARTAVKCLVAGFRALGLKNGDCVMINSLADIDYPILFLAIIAAGGIFTGCNPNYTANETLHQMKRTKTRFIFTESQYIKPILSAAKECDIITQNVFTFDHGDTSSNKEHKSWRSLLEHGEADWARFNDESIAKRTIAAYVMSSGTTGLPKAIVVTHYNFLAQQTLAYEAERRTFPVRRLLCLPPFATAAIYTNHICPLRGGEVSHIMPRFNTADFLNFIEKYAITELSLVPPMLVQILQHPLCTREKLKSIKFVHGGAAPVPKELQRKFQGLLQPDAPFTQVWGMSETSGVGTCLFWPEKDDTGSIGRPIPNLYIKLIDDDDNEIETHNTRGELCIKGPTVMKGYLDDEESTKRTFTEDGFLKTGDIVTVDGDTGKIYIVDRKKELIKVRAFQVAPPELEELLLSHEGILDVAVVGIDVPRLGTELPRAYVVRRDKSVDEEMVMGFVRERLVKYKWLEGGVVFVDAIPKSPSGKILKNILRERAKKEVGAKL